MVLKDPTQGYSQDHTHTESSLTLVLVGLPNSHCPLGVHRQSCSVLDLYELGRQGMAVAVALVLVWEWRELPGSSSCAFLVLPLSLAVGVIWAVDRV